MARNSMNSQRSMNVLAKTLMIFSICAIFFVAAYQGAHAEIEATISPKEVQQVKDVEITSSGTSIAATSTTAVPTNNKDSSDTLLKVLCYGDSLTAGVSPPNPEYSPYSVSLQQTLVAKSTVVGSTSTYAVSNIGLPGWTTSQFLSILDQENGLRKTIQDQGTAFDLVILLAGTNDLPQMLQGIPMDTANVDEQLVTTLTQNLMQLHQVAWTCGVRHTIALGIPGSAFQDHMSPAAAQMAQRVNQQLDLQASLKPDKMTFVPFPFPYVEGGENWSPDGLHFSRAGYQVLGETLAPVVQSILQPQT